MTAVLESTELQTTEESTDSAVRLASWRARAGAFSIDVLAGVAVIATLAVLAWTAPLYGRLWWVYTATAVVVLLAMLVNRVWLPTVTGWSVGRAVFGIRVVSSAASGGSGGDAGPVRLLLRDLAHLLDTAAVLVGWLWPLWDSRNRTFADLLTRTEVHQVDPPGTDWRRRAGVVLLASAILAGAAAGLGYFAVYRQDQAVHQARAQITDDGPRMVEQLLSYSVEEIDQDFARAQSLATDNYRSQLTAQQDAVKKSNPTNNDYWAVSSALLPGVTKTQAAMLLAMQGQRGTDPKDLKFITATLRVDFRKVDGQWQIDNLTVLKKPAMGAGP